jgi:L-malate glycosyltransferase
MRILHLIKSLGRGGAEMLLPETLKVHDKSAFEFHYIYFLPWKNQMVDSIVNAGGRVTCLPASNNVGIVLQARAIARYIKEHKIDLIHCHLPWAGFVGRLVKSFVNIPLVYTEHNKQERYHRATYWLNKASFRLQDHVIAVSGDVAESIRKHINTAVPVSVIHNGVNTDTFVKDRVAGMALKQKLGIPPEAVVVGVVAVFRFQKRLPEWLKVAASVLKGNSAVYAVIVGDGPLRGDVENAISDLGIADRVILAGLQTEMNPWYSLMDVYMMTSLYEGLPVALLEAMSTECAVISTDAGGIPEAVRDQVDGLLMPVEKFMELSGPLATLCADGELRKRFAQAARQRVLSNFSLTAMVKHLEHLYAKF